MNIILITSRTHFKKTLHMEKKIINRNKHIVSVYQPKFWLMLAKKAINDCWFCQKYLLN